MLIYTITYCALDERFEGNIFWHSCLLFSECDDQGGKMRVVDNWGFYGLPTTARDDILSKVKIRLGLDVDFEGNHGMLRHEDLRYLEMGFGLHGVTFEVTKSQFDELQARCVRMSEAQDAAIMEAVAALGVEKERAEKYRIYPFEKFSRQIFAYEMQMAAHDEREPRLKPFEIRPSCTKWGPALNQSRTCKSQTIMLLNGILTPAQISRLTENELHPTVPRYSGTMEDIYLHSSGPLRRHTKASGKIVYYRDSADAGVQLHWSLPPQEIETLSDTTRDLFLSGKKYIDEVKTVIGRLQRLEWLFMNAELPAVFQSYREDLLSRICEFYGVFSQVEPKQHGRSISGCQGYMLTLFSWPRNKDEKTLLDKLASAKNLITNLYAAIVDGWEINDDCPSEMDQGPVMGDMPYYNPLEALAAYLTAEDKMKLCSIVGRSYMEPLKRVGLA